MNIATVNASSASSLYGSQGNTPPTLQQIFQQALKSGQITQSQYNTAVSQLGQVSNTLQSEAQANGGTPTADQLQTAAQQIASIVQQSGIQSRHHHHHGGGAPASASSANSSSTDTDSSTSASANALSDQQTQIVYQSLLNALQGIQTSSNTQSTATASPASQGLYA